MHIEELYSIYLNNPIICTDTRKISTGCLFFALKGDNFNGNAFAQQALAEGAAYAIIDNSFQHTDFRTIIVDDVLTTLQQLAAFHRSQLSIPFIGITGSNGKTTTKELIKSVLSVKYNTYATLGNLNNHIGVPLTILAIDKHVEIAIIEMGANHQQEIAALCQIAKPTVALITNVGKAHLEGFGGFDGVKKGKGELYDFMKVSRGLIIANQDNVYLKEMISDRQLTNVLYYCVDSKCKISGRLVENNPFLVIDWADNEQPQRVKTNLTGPYNLENVLAAISIGIHFRLSADEINAGLTSYIPENNRSQITKTDTNTLICDYYNANPSSMNAALDNFVSLNADKKVLILGDMFELGDESDMEHKKVVEKALEIKPDKIFFVGVNFFHHKTDGAIFFENIGETLQHISTNQIKDSTVLIKGSRGMRLEKLLDFL